MSTMFIFSTLSPLSSALCVLVLEEQKLMVNEQIHQALALLHQRM
jgi:hypothetical protein